MTTAGAPLRPEERLKDKDRQRTITKRSQQSSAAPTSTDVLAAWMVAGFALLVMFGTAFQATDQLAALGLVFVVAAAIVLTPDLMSFPTRLLMAASAPRCKVGLTILCAMLILGTVALVKQGASATLVLVVGLLALLALWFGVLLWVFHSTRLVFDDARLVKWLMRLRGRGGTPGHYGIVLTLLGLGILLQFIAVF